jgi:hypothetical protein
MPQFHDLMIFFENRFSFFGKCCLLGCLFLCLLRSTINVKHYQGKANLNWPRLISHIAQNTAQFWNGVWLCCCCCCCCCFRGLFIVCLFLFVCFAFLVFVFAELMTFADCEMVAGKYCVRLHPLRKKIQFHPTTKRFNYL